MGRAVDNYTIHCLRDDLMGSDESSERHTMMLMFSVLAFNRAPRIWTIVGSTIFLIFTLVNVAFIVDEETSKWEPISAEIVDTSVQRNICTNYNGCESGGYYPHIQFRWQNNVAGEWEYSDSYSKKVVNKSSLGAALEWLEDYPVGSNTTAYVNPDDPSDAVLITHTWIQMIGLGSILYNLLCASTCLLLPLLALFTARSFEKTLPEHSHKRYKLVYGDTMIDGQKGKGWDSDPEAMKLQAMARSVWIKKNSDSLDMDEALMTSAVLDAQTKLEGGSRILNVRFDGQDGTIEVRTMNDILENIGEIDEIAILYLEDSKKMGRYLEFRSDDSGDDWYFHIREFLGEELILQESINMDHNHLAMIEIISNALKSLETEDDEWWT